MDGEHIVVVELLKYFGTLKKGKKIADAQKTEISVSEDGDFGELKNMEIPSKRRRVGRYGC